MYSMEILTSCEDMNSRSIIVVALLELSFFNSLVEAFSNRFSCPSTVRNNKDKKEYHLVSVLGQVNVFHRCSLEVLGNGRWVACCGCHLENTALTHGLVL